MKKLLFLFTLMLFPILASAQTVSDVQNSGCTARARGAAGEEPVPTIVLTKEDNILSVEVLNYEANCCTDNFHVTSNINGGSDGSPSSLSISVVPVGALDCDCECPFNVSFTIRDFEPNSFYLKCWWYEGLVELTNGVPLVLEYKVEDVVIGEMSFRLLKVMHKAKLTKWTTEEKEIRIPSEVTYEGENYTVTSIDHDAFGDLDHLAKIAIPKTIRSTDLDVDGIIWANPFRECKSLEWIEVEEGCPLLSSVDGVLFAKNKTMLLGYPIASPRETYTVPEGVTNIRSGSFYHNKYLRKLVIPEGVTYLGWHLFSDTKSLEALYIKGVLDPECIVDGLFGDMSTNVNIYVLPSEVDKFKAIYKGPVYPLSDESQEYFPEGTKWTEIRLDTLKYDSWYSKVGNEWVPNFETIEYYVKGDYVKTEWDNQNTFKKVYTNGPEWTDSLTLLIQETEYNGHNSILASVLSHEYDGDKVLWPGEAYQFDWNVGKGLYYEDILMSNTTSMWQPRFYYGIIDEIKEGDFGGVRPLMYVDLDGKAPDDETGLNRYVSTNGGRIIQGIGITEWNDGECLFGPPNPYFASTGERGKRHYRSMLVHFERNGEVLYDVWPKKEVTYRPFVEDNKEWTMAYLGAVPPEYQQTFSYEQIKLGSALEVNGMTFKQIVSSSWWNDQDGPTNWKETDEYLGEADGKMYLYNKKSQNTVQIMDFTLQVGDTYRQMQMGDPNDYMDFVVTAVTDTVIATSIDKTPRKCLYLSRPGSTNIDEVWIEGIGSLVGGVRGALEHLKVGAIPMLRKCQKDGQILYEAYHPLLKEGKTWNFEDRYYDHENKEEWTKYVSYVINGTTEIDGKTYYKMYRVTEEGSEYYCALREEDKKVWTYSGDDGEKLLYDFNMSAGDSYMPVNEWNVFHLTEVKPVRFNYNLLLNVQHFVVHRPLEDWNIPVVEGVGCSKGWELARVFWQYPTGDIINIENFVSCYEDGKCIFTADDFENIPTPKPVDDMAYRPFVEDGKVWKAGSTAGISDGIVKMVEYYYFDGDTIMDGRTCKQMMCQRYVSPNHPDYAAMSQIPSLRYIGAWYEEDKKVYIYNAINQLKMTYDFSLEANDTLFIDNQPYVIGPKQTGGLEGFKGVYRDIMWCFGGDPYYNYNTTWLEGVGGIDGPTVNVYSGEEGHGLFLMSCTVGDEVIYLNDEYQDGATPETSNAPKSRFDFTHIVKDKPKAPKRRGAEQPLYGEYNDQQLGINLAPLAEAYLVRINDESGKVVYEKAINTGNIVALSIDISAYSQGRYTVTIENSRESFTGEFDTLATGIEEVRCKTEEVRNAIYNLQGQRISSLQKGLNIVNGKKVYVK